VYPQTTLYQRFCLLLTSESEYFFCTLHCCTISLFVTIGNSALHNTPCCSHNSLLPQPKTVNSPRTCLYMSAQIALQTLRNFSIALGSGTFPRDSEIFENRIWRSERLSPLVSLTTASQLLIVTSRLAERPWETMKVTI
jgi:hypothetical protein